MPPKPRPIEDRLRAWIRVDESGCWLIDFGSADARGYKRIWNNTTKKQEQVHRVAHELWIGPIPVNYEVDHLCFVPNCVNPEHLEAVTHAENCRRVSEKGRHWQQKKSCCPQGHSYKEHGTVTTRGNGSTFRKCRVCDLTDTHRRRGQLVTR